MKRVRVTAIVAFVSALGILGAWGLPASLDPTPADASSVTGVVASSSVVATAAGNPITLQAFKHWMFIAAKQQSAQATKQGQSEPVIVANDPPHFTSCIKEVRRVVPTLAKTSAATLRKDCKQVFKQLSSEVMAFLIEGYWYQADAYKLGLKVTDGQVNKAFAKAKNAEFPTAAGFRNYLKTSGYTKQDLLFQIRVNLAYSKLLKTETKATGRSSEARAVNQQTTQEFKASTLCATYFMMNRCGASEPTVSPATTEPGVQLAPSGGATTPRLTTTLKPAATVTTPKTGPLSKEPKITLPTTPPPKTLVKKDLIVGTGATAKAGDEVEVNYVGELYSNGKIFDASWKDTPGRAFGPVQLGSGALIPGWDRGLVGMKVGGRRELIIPPSLAYKNKREGSIPPNSTLIFVVDLLSVTK